MRIIPLLLLPVLIVRAQIHTAYQVNNAAHFIDSIAAPYTVTNVPDTVYFSSSIIDTSRFIAGAGILFSCTEKLLFAPIIIESFDTTEYQYFRTQPGLTFRDSLNFLENNNITAMWFRVYAFADHRIWKMQKLGIDINVDFGNVLSESYYEDGRLVLYINRICGSREHSVLLIKYLNRGSRTLSEETYIIQDDGEVHQLTQNFE